MYPQYFFPQETQLQQASSRQVWQCVIAFERTTIQSSLEANRCFSSVLQPTVKIVDALVDERPKSFPKKK